MTGVDGPSDALPILVGVTGKRQFDADPVRNAALLERVRERLRSVFERLDAKLPDTPKVLLCGAAAGTDLTAVRVALERPSWSVVLMLPLERNLFEQDFREAPFAAELPYLHVLLDGGDPRVLVKRLRSLHQVEFDDAKLEPPAASRFVCAHLSKDSPTLDAVARRAHFEQLGLWLARYATLLVTVGPAEAATRERPFRVGGTARVVAFRRTAMPDAAAAWVIARSSELLANSPFEEPDGAHVLWLDPTRDTLDPRAELPEVAVLPRLGMSSKSVKGTGALATCATRFTPPRCSTRSTPRGDRHWTTATRLIWSAPSRS